jgi:metallo-beta-lactamase family protein
MATITHHGGTRGVTGSCHRLTFDDGQAVLIDCGLIQGDDRGADGASSDALAVTFDLSAVRAVVLTHVHIDHVGRLPYLLAAGFEGPILCSEASAALLPLVLEDALKVGFTRDWRLIERFLAVLAQRLIPVPHGEWITLFPGDAASPQVRLQPAGHILGAAYLEFDVNGERIVFSGDLGPPGSPLLPDVVPPERADVLVLESTYGDRIHEDRSARRDRLKSVVEHALADGGTVIVPAFSVGRTQELLYELEAIFTEAGAGPWESLQVVLDSPLAADFTRGYGTLRAFWDAEAKARVAAGRHPLAFEQLVTVASHDDHARMVNYLARSRQPALVLAASGMCAGGRVVNYLKAMLGDPRHDVLFVGYQAAGTPGRTIQRFGPRGGWVALDGERLDIRCGVHTLGGYSAHADQAGLVAFARDIPAGPPKDIRLVHGDDGAKAALAAALKAAVPSARVVVPS